MRLPMITVICILFQVLDCQGGSVTPIKRLNFFDIDLLRATAEGKKGNVMISPASIKSTLAMILEGAKGPTAKEIKTALRVSPRKDDFREDMRVFGEVLEPNSTIISLQNANALFVSNKLNLKTQYESIVQRLYSAEVNRLDFNNPKSSAETVNHWVDKKTRGLIPTIVSADQISPSTELMVTNALYFKAPWKHGFPAKATHKDCFYNRGVCKYVSMMLLQDELNYAYVDTLRAEAIELPYQDDRYSMILIVPKDQNEEIDQLRDLPYVGLTQISERMESVDIVLTMPKFDLEYSDDMVEPLKNLNIKTLFSQSANLSGIFGSGEYSHLNSIYHSVHMKVDEVGTVAAAASSSVVVPLINDQLQVQINHPFLFFIMDNKHGVILFEGKIEDPTEFVATSSSQDQLKVPEQVAEQPLAGYNSQKQASGQTNPSIFYPVDAVGPTYNQNALNQFSSHPGNLNQHLLPPNLPNINHTTVHQGQSQSNSGLFTPGQPQVVQQKPPNQTSFNTKPGPGTNNTSSQSSSPQVISCILFPILDCDGGESINRQSFFDLELLRYSAEDKTGNVMISPASIKSTLALLLEGAKGQTAAEISTALRVSPDRYDFREEMKVFMRAFEANNPTVTVQNANALFISNKLKLNQQYEAIAQRLYLAEIKKLNFYNPQNAADTVNKWVDQRTHGLIPNIVEQGDITPSTQMMITNALYFKAPWQNGFNIKKTYSDCFYNNGVCRKVAMMQLIAKLKYAYVPTLKSYALELPYQGDRYSMLLVVPRDPNAELSLIRDLPHIGLSHIDELFDRVEVILTMPKFDVEYRDDMVGPLRNMRITTLFSQYANLSGIFGIDQYANVNRIFHSVHMKVDEAGTIAAAASNSAVVALSNDQARLEINKPFLFFIKDNMLDVILFEGKIEEPTEFVETGSAEAQPQVPQQAINQPIPSTILRPQASGQSNFNEATTRYPSNQPDLSAINYNQAVLNQQSYYPGPLGQQVFQSNPQVPNNIYQYRSQLTSSTSPPTTHGTTTKDPFKVKSYYCLLCF